MKNITWYQNNFDMDSFIYVNLYFGKFYNFPNIICETIFQKLFTCHHDIHSQKDDMALKNITLY